MRIAIIGTGIAGNTVAYKLRERFDITVYESEAYVGGHTNTIDVVDGDRTIPVDTGFIVFNDRTYPNFQRLLAEIGQTWRPTEMSFSVHDAVGAFEYNGSSLNGLFADRRNLLRPRFYRMIRDILRFNREAVLDINASREHLSLGDYLEFRHYGNEFRDRYLVPMAAAIWSAEPGAVLDMPAAFLVRFFKNHGLLQLDNRPQWQVIEGGSREYVRRLVDGHRDRIRLNSPVTSVRRSGEGVEVSTGAGGREWYDYAFLACHSDQALRMLADPTPAERAILGAIRYQRNEAILHTDTSVLPARRRAWAAWNYFVPEDSTRHVAVSYNMNILQRIESATTFVVTLNDDSRIDESKIIRRIGYQHPMFTRESMAAQSRQAELNVDRTFFCGAYWRNGFHEDGVVSALNALEHFEERLAHGKLYLRRAS